MRVVVQRQLLKVVACNENNDTILWGAAEGGVLTGGSSLSAEVTNADPAVVLDVMGKGSGASKYTIYASLSNFPIWWLGLLLGRAADQYGAANMLYVEAVLGVLGVLVFAAVGKAWRNREEPPTAAVV